VDRRTLKHGIRKSSCRVSPDSEVQISNEFRLLHGGMNLRSGIEKSHPYAQNQVPGRTPDHPPSLLILAPCLGSYIDEWAHAPATATTRLTSNFNHDGFRIATRKSVSPFFVCYTFCYTSASRMRTRIS